MNKASKLITLISLGISIMVNAESISFRHAQMKLKSGYVKKIGKIEISAEENGLLRVFQDKNICYSNGSCTKVYFYPEFVKPKFIKDRRNEAGELVFKLTDQINLIVSPAKNQNLVPKYSAEVNSSTRVPLMVDFWPIIQ